MDPFKNKKDLLIFFERFSAENNLNEAHLEKIERVLHTIKPKSMAKIEKLCGFIIKHSLQDMPEDEIIDDLKERKLI